VPEGPGVYRSSRGTGLMVVESAVLHARLLAQGHDALSDLVIERDADALARWLAAPDAPAS